jgi:hypothetical protein
MSVQQWLQSDTAPWSKVNENAESLGQAFFGSQNHDAHTGLTVGINGGNFDETTVADATLACTDDDTNYIVCHRATPAFTVAITTTNWDDTATYGRVARAVFASGVLTWHDERHSPGGIFDNGSVDGVSDGDKGDITVSGTGATWTIDNDVVTYAKMQNVSAASKLLGRGDSGAGDTQEITLGTGLSMSGTTLNSSAALADGDKGDITVSASGATWTIDNAAVTLAKIANASANSKLLGSGAAGSGASYAELTLGTGLSMSGTTLNASGVSDADDVTYAPTTLADWDGGTDPGDVEQALDQLAERVTDLEAAGGGSTVGKHAIWISAGSMSPSAAGGCSYLSNIASAANQPDIQTLDFDPTTQEYAQFSVVMPKSWDEGTVTFAPRWSHAATTTNFGVVWDLQGVAVSNDDTIAAAYGTAQTSTDTGGTTDDLYAGPESSAITIAGTPAAEDTVFFRISRVTGNGSDTMAIDARLMGIVLYITTDASNDA